VRGKKKGEAGSDYTTAVEEPSGSAGSRNNENPYKKLDFHSTKMVTRE